MGFRQEVEDSRTLHGQVSAAPADSGRTAAGVKLGAHMNRGLQLARATTINSQLWLESRGTARDGVRIEARRKPGAADQQQQQQTKMQSDKLDLFFSRFGRKVFRLFRYFAFARVVVASGRVWSGLV